MWKSAKAFQSKAEGLELTVESWVRQCQEGEKSALEAWRLASKAVLKTGAPLKEQRQQASPLLSLFIPPRMQAYWLVPVTLRLDLPSSVNPFSYIQNYVEPISGGFLIKLTQQLTVTAIQ